MNRFFSFVIVQACSTMRIGQFHNEMNIICNLFLYQKCYEQKKGEHALYDV